MVTEIEQTRLSRIVGNLKLKELEIVEKLSNNISNESKMLRSLVSPNKHNFIAVNGDWEEILGYTEEECRGNNFCMILPPHEVDRTNLFIDKLQSVKDGFSEYKCDIITKSGKILKTIWKSKYYSDINTVISLGRIV
jgi:PAS domain S-box-containing protein